MEEGENYSVPEGSYTITRELAILALLEMAFTEGIEAPGLTQTIRELEKLLPETDVVIVFNESTNNIDFEAIDENDDAMANTIYAPREWLRYWWGLWISGQKLLPCEIDPSSDVGNTEVFPFRTSTPRRGAKS